MGTIRQGLDRIQGVAAKSTERGSELSDTAAHPHVSTAVLGLVGARGT